MLFEQEIDAIEFESTTRPYFPWPLRSDKAGELEKPSGESRSLGMLESMIFEQEIDAIEFESTTRPYFSWPLRSG